MVQHFRDTTTPTLGNVKKSVAERITSSQRQYEKKGKALGSRHQQLQYDKPGQGNDTDVMVQISEPHIYDEEPMLRKVIRLFANKLMVDSEPHMVLNVEKGIVELFFFGTEYQLADLFTKALSEDRFKYLGRMPTKIELTLEQSQQGVSNDVLQDHEAFNEDTPSAPPFLDSDGPIKQEEHHQPSNANHTSLRSNSCDLEAKPIIKRKTINMIHSKPSNGCESDSDVEEDIISSKESLADLNLEFHDRALLANQKIFYKR
ncbi:hypothetical protein Tco_0566769 [Tanacetum coccineum]